MALAGQLLDKRFSLTAIGLDNHRAHGRYIAMPAARKIGPKGRVADKRVNPRRLGKRRQSGQADNASGSTAEETSAAVEGYHFESHLDTTLNTIGQSLRITYFQAVNP
jgi:hypothetical protein